MMTEEEATLCAEISHLVGAVAMCCYVGDDDVQLSSVEPLLDKAFEIVPDTPENEAKLNEVLDKFYLEITKMLFTEKGLNEITEFLTCDIPDPELDEIFQTARVGFVDRVGRLEQIWARRDGLGG